MKPEQLTRWESWRRKGFQRFVLAFGLVRVGLTLVLLEVLTTILAFAEARRVLRAGGSSPTLLFSDYLSITLRFTPRLLLIAFGGGALFAVVMWLFMERLYRRAVQRA